MTTIESPARGAGAITPGRGPRVIGKTVRGAWAAWVVAVVLGAAGWQLLSMQSGGWVPSVPELVDAFGAVLTDPALFDNMRVTLVRVLWILAGSIALGMLVGVVAGFSWRIRAFVRPILVMALAIPDLVYIILAILILGVGGSSGIIAVIIAVTPLVTNVVLGSVLERDTRLDEMAKTYRLGPVDYGRHVLLRQIQPALIAALKTAFAFSWKLVVLMEAITAPDGIGAQIMVEFKYLRAAEMIAYAVIFTVLMKVVEIAILSVLQRNQRHYTRK